MNSKKQDIKFGLENETKVIPTLSSFFNTELIKDPNPYAVHDWYNETKTIHVELKSRRIKHNEYSTALIGLNKINSCKNPDVKYYFVWMYNDGLFYIKYDKEIFDKFVIEKDYTIKKRYDVGRIEKSDVMHIPYTSLLKLPNTIIL